MPPNSRNLEGVAVTPNTVCLIPPWPSPRQQTESHQGQKGALGVNTDLDLRAVHGDCLCPGEVDNFDSRCPHYDMVLSEIHRRQTHSPPVAYVPLDQQLSDPDLMSGRASKGELTAVEPLSTLPVCLPGQCMVQRNYGFEIMAADSALAQCAIYC